MPRHAELNWDRSRGKWKVVYRGKKYRFAGGTGRSDREAKKLAEAEWRRTKSKVDAAVNAQKPHQVEYTALLEQWNLVLQWSVEHDDQTSAQAARDAMQRLRRGLAKETPPAPAFSDHIESLYTFSPEHLAPIVAKMRANASTPSHKTTLFEPEELELAHDLDGSEARIQNELWTDRIASQRAKQRDLSESLEAHIGEFLTQRRRRVGDNSLSAGRCDALRIHLHRFRDWAGPATSITQLSGRMLMKYHAELMEDIAAGRVSAAYAKDQLGSVTSFVRWLWRSEAIPSLPRVLAGKDLAISTAVKTPSVFTIEEITMLLARATDRTKLYVLLMLNTGMTQKDICDLRQSEVDWNLGVITRKRSKTAQFDKVPTVQYRLWRETFRLLRQERAKDCHSALLNADGGPLKFEAISGDGKLQKIDNVASAFNRLRRATKISKPSKLFRKTSATLLRSNKEFSGLETLFLGHAPTTISDRHYAQAPQQLLDEAIEWLGRQYKLLGNSSRTSSD